MNEGLIICLLVFSWTLWAWNTTERRTELKVYASVDVFWHSQAVEKVGFIHYVTLEVPGRQALVLVALIMHVREKEGILHVMTVLCLLLFYM